MVTNAKILTASIWQEWRRWVVTLVVLFKLRIVALLLLAAISGTFLGAGSFPGIDSLFLIVVTGGLVASGASALNQYLERESDKHMRRTQFRPLVTKTIQPEWVLVISLALVFIPSLIVLSFNPALAFFLLLGAMIYVGVYTIWLKPRTVLNIVIGGAAGSAAVISGGAAVGNWQDPGVIMLALLIFLWTPAHFWSLAIMYRDDYKLANVPMLPAKLSVQLTSRWILVHTVAMGIAALILGLTSQLGWLYSLPIMVATGSIVWRALRLTQNPTRDRALSMFLSSNLYLTVIFAMVCLDILL